MKEINILLSQARTWVENDPDPRTQNELESLISAAQAGDAEAHKSLDSRFSGPLTFGTAGLRGEIGAGETRMNLAVVIRAAAGLSAYLHSELGDGFSVVIGNDARYGSRDFALATAQVVTAAGGRAILLPSQLPTPVLAFATRHLNADAGVMVTASHNPPADNGYKVYLGGRVVTDFGQGAQIVPPYDKNIADFIAHAPSAKQIARAESGWEEAGKEIETAYLAQLAVLLPNSTSDPKVAEQRKNLSIVHTSMHGVGSGTSMQAFAQAGFSTLVEVAEQREPNPDFPTVSFPNPEEPGALDLAIKLAEERKADLVIANDPDADRCSAAICQPDGGWRQLTGDEIGALLGEQTATQINSPSDSTLACSIVSSRQLEKIAAAHGLNFAATLTGFKWISRQPNLVFGYEEAIGFCVDPAHVRDKDGISASLRIAELAASLKAEGRTLQDALDDLARQHGLYTSSQVSVRVEDLSLIAKAMYKVRYEPPTHLEGSEITTHADLNEGFQGLPPTDAILLLTANDTRVIVRPSGTEPKLKCYLELIEPVGSEEDIAVVRERAAQRMAILRSDVQAMVAV